MIPDPRLFEVDKSPRIRDFPTSCSIFLLRKEWATESDCNAMSGQVGLVKRSGQKDFLSKKLPMPVNSLPDPGIGDRFKKDVAVRATNVDIIIHI